MNGAALQFERESPRAEQAVRAFAEQAATLQPPLVKPALEATLASLLCAGLVLSFWLNLQAEWGEVWAAEALRGSETWLFGAVKVVFGRPPGGPLGSGPANVPIYLSLAKTPFEDDCPQLNVTGETELPGLSLSCPRRLPQ